MTPEVRTKNAEYAAVVSLAESCVKRLLGLGLPEKQAFAARDAVIGHLENYASRIRCGEWSQPPNEAFCGSDWNPPPGMDA